jgi:hypothetical protein
LAEEIRVKAAIGFLQEKRAAFAAHQVAHPEFAPALLRLNVQPAGALEFLAAIELADTPAKMLAEIEAAKAAIVIPARRVAVRVKIEGIFRVDRNTLLNRIIEKGFLPGLLDCLPLQLANLRLDQVTDQEFFVPGCFMK